MTGAQNLRRAVLSVLLLVLGVGVLAAQPAAAEASTCGASPRTDGSSTTVCLSVPAGDLTGDVTASATVSGTGSGGSVNIVRFSLDGQYLLSDHQAPYTFRLPTSWYVDGSHRLSAQSVHWDGFSSAPVALDVVLSNGNATTPAPNGATFTPRGAEPAAGQPLVVAATGDGAGGKATARDVSDLVTGWDPDLFLYLGDVYARGSRAEFDNWYGRSDELFGRLRDVTNPTIGNHEYQVSGAAGYRAYWDNVPSSYSYDRGGWHFVSLDTNESVKQVHSGTAQFEWLMSDLAGAAETPCTLVYFHHPVRSIGDLSDDERLDELWRLLADHGVDVVLTAHDHNYQRWAALDADGQPDAEGTVQFVAGGGGHSVFPATRSDPRVLASETTAPEAYGALRLDLLPDGGTAQYVDRTGAVVDESELTCSPALRRAPDAPTDVRATAQDAAAAVAWAAPADNGSAITGYTATSSPGGLTCTTTGANGCWVAGLRNGTAYSFTVTATNAVGTGAASAPSAEVTPTAPPGPPPTDPPPTDPPPTDPPPSEPPPEEPPPVEPTGPQARGIDGACPSDRVPAHAFTDVAAGSTHDRAIGCLVWWGVANGRTATSYVPADGVTRDAMAAFVARTIEAAAPGSLPDAPPDAFVDDGGSVHQHAIDQLAAVGIVGGTGGGAYSPSGVVTRGQMAKFLANAAAHVLGRPLTAAGDLFPDDGTSPFQDDINRVAQAGLTGGRPDGTYDPVGPVRRDQMGSFLARTLDLLVGAAGARLPA